MSDFNKLSDLLLDERNDSTVTDQEVADYVASVRMGTAAVSSQPVPQLNRPQPINNQPTPKPTPPTQATHAQQEQCTFHFFSFLLSFFLFIFLF